MGVDRLRKHCGLLSLTVRRPPLLPAQHCSSAQHLRLAAITCLWKWPSPCSLPYSSLSAETLFLFIPTTLLKVTASALVSCSLLKHQLGFFLPALDHQQQQDHWHQHRQIQWSLLAPLLAFFRHHGHFSKFSITSPITMEGCLVFLFFPAPNPGHRAQGPRLLCTSLSPPSWSHLTATSQALGASPVPFLLKLLPYLDTQMLDNPFHIWWAKQSLHIRATSPHLGSKSAILTLKHTISQLMREGRNSLSSCPGPLHHPSPQYYRQYVFISNSPFPPSLLLPQYPKASCRSPGWPDHGHCHILPGQPLQGSWSALDDK